MLNKYTKFIIYAILSLYGTTMVSASKVEVVKNEDGWKLLVDSKPFFVKGMCYLPTKAGEDPNEGTWSDWMTVDDDGDGRIDAPFQSWVDKNQNNKRDPGEFETGDFKLLKEMGCNTIRIYHHASASPEIQAINLNQTSSPALYNHAPNKELLRILHKAFGIYVAMGNFLGAYTVASGASWESGTDYSDPVQRKNMLQSVEDMVREFKDEPYILMWILGNENNYREYTHTNASQEPEIYAKFVDEVAKRIHELDPNHPVCLANGETQLVYLYAQHAPNIDIFGTNSYRSPGFGTLWNQIATSYDKPVLLTEFGTSNPRIENGVLDEKYQATIHRAAWCDIVRHSAGGSSPGNAIGGFVHEWMDNWWKDWNPAEHNLAEKGGWHLEWHGISSQGDGLFSPLLRQLREVYFTYQELWTSATPECRKQVIPQQ